MPGVEATAPAALLFFFFGHRGHGRCCGRGRLCPAHWVHVCMGLGVCSGPLLCRASLGRLSSARSSVTSAVCCTMHYSSRGHQSCFALTFLEGSTPSLSYMICPDLVQCVSVPLWQTLVCTQTIVCLLLFRQFSVCPPTHPMGGRGGCRDGRGYGGGGDLGRTAWWVPVAGCVAPSSLRLGGSRGFRRPCMCDPPPPTTTARVCGRHAFVCLPTPPPTGG